MKDISGLFPKREKNKLNIYFHCSENSGVGFYRQYLPAWKLREHDLAKVMINDFRWGEGDQLEPTIPTLYPIMNWADIVVVGRRDIPEFYAQWGAIRDYFNMPIIMDTDDDVRNVRPENPGYQGYHPSSPAILMNKYATIRIFDAITVSTEHLKDVLKRENPKIFVLPNNLDVQEWDKHKKKKYDDKLIRIGFIASGTHSLGVNIIKQPIIDILKKYPNTRFLITHIYKHFFSDQSKEIQNKIEPIPWIALKEWPQKSKELGLDIGLAPLADNLFNRSKSNLRWMEYSLAKTPVVASPVKPYFCIKNNITGLLAKERDEWYNQIEKLVIDSELRQKLATNAYKEISEKYNIDKNIELWDKNYREVHDKFHQFFGPKKQFQFLGKGKYKQIN